MAPCFREPYDHQPNQTSRGRNAAPASRQCARPIQEAARQNRTKYPAIGFTIRIIVDSGGHVRSVAAHPLPSPYQSALGGVHLRTRARGGGLIADKVTRDNAYQGNSGCAPQLRAQGRDREGHTILAAERVGAMPMRWKSSVVCRCRDQPLAGLYLGREPLRERAGR
jgi:hypothetical protein